MAIRTPEDIDFSTFPESDGEPMAETSANALQMIDLIWSLQGLFDRQGRLGTTTVGGNQLVYYNPLNGRDNISPDVYVAFDRPPPAPPKWQTWLEGGFPDVVFEITSSSTRHVDVSEAPRGKRRLYAELGAGEYYIYDPQQETEPPFEGFELREGRMEPLPLLPGGGIYSPLLGAELRPVARGETQRRPAGIWLRVIDPGTGEPIPITDEEHSDLQTLRDLVAAQREQLALGEQLRASLEGQLAVRERLQVAAEEQLAVRERLQAALEGQLAAAEGRADLEHRLRVALEGLLADVEGRLAEVERRADLEHQIRVTAEERAVRAEAALQALLAERGDSPDAGPGPAPA